MKKIASNNSNRAVKTGFKPMTLSIGERYVKRTGFNSDGKKLVRVDSRTCIYVPDTATAKQIEQLIKPYQKVK